MIITAIDTNIFDSPEFVSGREINSVDFEDLDLDKRIQRRSILGGQELGLRLHPGHPLLREGDVLYADDNIVHVVRIVPTDVLVIKPVDIHHMGFVAHSLGNRHLPALFLRADELARLGVSSEDAAMVVQFDHTVVAFLDEHQVSYERTELVPPVPFRHHSSGHTH